MDEKIDATADQKDLPTNTPCPADVASKPPPIEEPCCNSEANKNSEKMSKSDIIMSVATVVIAIGTIVSAVAIVFQWREMHSGSADTSAIRDAAQKQAKAAESFATSADGINTKLVSAVDKLNDQATAMGKVADQAIIQANANKKLAQNAIDTLANTRESQRAWIGVQEAGDSKGFTDTEVWQITIAFFNSGRTPAKNVQISGMYITSPKPLSGPPAENIAQLTFRPTQSIAPQGFYREIMGANPGAQGATDAELFGQRVLITQYPQIKSKQLFLYYFGLLKYDDINGNHHQTQYCILLANPDTRESGMCNSFNDLN